MRGSVHKRKWQYLQLARNEKERDKSVRYNYRPDCRDSTCVDYSDFGVKGPILSFKRKKFLERNDGKIVLCVSPGSKYKTLLKLHNDEIMSTGIHCVVVFDPTKPDNQYDGFEWDGMISRDQGFPILLKFSGDKIVQQPLKNEFIAFFKKEIDMIQLKGCIKDVVDGKSY